jgi:hypothetical protein
MVRQAMQTYVVAVKRGSRDTAPPDWIEQLRNVPGVIIRGSPGPIRVQVEATEEAAAEIRKRLGGFAHVEAAIMHKPS